MLSQPLLFPVELQVLAAAMPASQLDRIEAPSPHSSRVSTASWERSPQASTCHQTWCKTSLAGGTPRSLLGGVGSLPGIGDWCTNFISRALCRLRESEQSYQHVHSSPGTCPPLLTLVQQSLPPGSVSAEVVSVPHMQQQEGAHPNTGLDRGSGAKTDFPVCVPEPDLVSSPHFLGCVVRGLVVRLQRGRGCITNVDPVLNSQEMVRTVSVDGSCLRPHHWVWGLGQVTYQLCALFLPSMTARL